MIPFFKSQEGYTVRKTGKQKIVQGYATSGYAEIKNVPLDVQVLSNERSQDSGGARSTTRISAFGQFKFEVAESDRIRGDFLQYEDKWYECVSCVPHKNTLLSHYYAEFVLIPDGGKLDNIGGGFDDDF